MISYILFLTTNQSGITNRDDIYMKLYFIDNRKILLHAYKLKKEYLMTFD